MVLKRLQMIGAALCALAFVLSLGVPGLLWGGGYTHAAVSADATAPDVEGAPTDVGEGTGQRLVAITFDDGPRRSTTTRLLDGLALRGVKGTFFLVGQNVGVNEDVVQRMEREGHQVGLHTYDHATKLTGLNRTDFAAQVDKTRNLLAQLLGHSDFVLRPPYGMTDGGVKAWAGAPIILWSVDPEDWKDQNADQAVQFMVEQVKDGDIILLHDIFEPSVEAALRTIDALHQKGFLFVTVDELFRQRHVELESGKIYWNAYP